MNEINKQFERATKVAMDNAQAVMAAGMGFAEKAAAMNMGAARKAVESFAQGAAVLAAARTPADMAAVPSKFAFVIDDSLGYAKGCWALAESFGGEVAKGVEAGAVQAKTAVSEGFDKVAKMAPAGGEGAISAARGAVDSGFAAAANARGMAAAAGGVIAKGVASAAESVVKAAKKGVKAEK